MKKLDVKTLTRIGLLIAISLILSYIESLIPIPMPVPGMRIGLANIVSVYAIYTLTPKQSLFVVLAKVTLMMLSFGNMSMALYSYAGSLLSLGAMLAAKKMGLNVVITSTIGGITHNLGQLVVAYFILNLKNSPTLLSSLLTTLLILGAISGAALGVIAATTLRAMKNNKIE